MTRRPRRDVILRRFMAGWSIFHIVWHYRRSGLLRVDVEQAIREAMNRKGKR